MEDQEPRDADDGDELEAAIMQTDHAFGAESVGTTAEEGLEGESLDERLAEERPERQSIDEALSVVDEGLSDDEGELVGDAVLERDEFASPEEAALSVRDKAPGATDHDDPHPDQGGLSDFGSGCTPSVQVRSCASGTGSKFVSVAGPRSHCSADRPRYNLRCRMRQCALGG